MARTTVKYGIRNADVTVAQLLLGVGADGVFGGVTQKAVQALQAQKNLKVDGIVGPKTWAALAAEADTVRKGSRGNTVKALQILLAANPDGVFGSKTDAAARAYQTSAALTVDGIVGPKTWASLLAGTANIVVPSDGKPVYYRQNDPRWGSQAYTSTGNASQTIANSGCVPTTLAMIVTQLTGREVLPPVLCELAVANGFRSANSGTYRSFVRFVAEEYALKSYSTDMAGVKAALSEGKLVAAFMGPGYWTNGGHCILLWKYDGAQDAIYANDPASAARTQQGAVQMKAEANQFFVVSK